MSFTEEIKKFAERAKSLKDKLETEEATKTSLILPFFRLLGYDVFNPDEFVPEFTADVGIKKGEKVDYAIMKDGKPLILIEAKPCSKNDLLKFASQLFRYFGTTEAKFSILTNGIVYMFYTDLEEPNKMDTKPFFEFDLLNLRDSKINELGRFRKESLDVDTIMSSASELKYSGEIKQLMARILDEPSDAFINLVLAEIYSGKRTQAAKDKFKDLIRSSVNQYINELMNERIKSAIEKSASKEDPPKNTENEVAATTEDIVIENRIETTMEELESYFVMKSIFRGIVDVERIAYKDTLSYFVILLDNNTWKWICRVYIKDSVKYITIPDESKKEIRYEIDTVQNIHDYKDELIKSLKRYLE